MSYCDLDDLKDRIDEEEIISLTDDENLGAVNTNRTNAAITAADALINAYCARRYDVPFDPVPEIITMLSVDIAVYKLFSRRGRAGETERNAYNDAVKFLKDVAEKRANIDGAVDEPAEKASHPAVITTSPRIFSRTKMEGF